MTDTGFLESPPLPTSYYRQLYSRIEDYGLKEKITCGSAVAGSQAVGHPLQPIVGQYFRLIMLDPTAHRLSQTYLLIHGRPRLAPFACTSPCSYMLKWDSSSPPFNQDPLAFCIHFSCRVYRDTSILLFGIIPVHRRRYGAF